MVNPGLAALWEDEHQRRRMQGRETQPTPLSTQQRNPAGPSSTEEFHRCRLFEKLSELVYFCGININVKFTCVCFVREK